MTNGSRDPLCDLVTDAPSMRVLVLVPVTESGAVRAMNPLTETSMSLLARNVGTIDRTLRVIVGIILIAMVFFGPQTSWGWIGLVPLITGIIGSCPAYRLFGLRTCPISSSQA